MANYQIKLTPVETFFFGGEKHSLNTNSQPVADYFTESNLYPQQTTLLGLVRYLLLVKNDAIFKNNRIIDKVKASEYIGESSFDFSNKGNNHGKIKSISSLYFAFENESYFFAPLDYGSNLKDNFILEKEIDNKLKEYTAKDQSEFIEQAIVSNSGDMRRVEDIVKGFSMVGNEKGENGTPKEDAFYKQSMKFLAPGWSFAIDVDLEDSAGLPDTGELFIPFGGEKCYFKIEINKKAKYLAILPAAYQRTCLAIICISDCFLDDTSLLHKTDFAINDFVSFRNLQSKVSSTQKYSGLSKSDPVQIKQGNRYNLLKRGSVLYFKKSEFFNEAKATIENNKNLTDIGFNHILTINN